MDSTLSSIYDKDINLSTARRMELATVVMGNQNCGFNVYIYEMHVTKKPAFDTFGNKYLRKYYKRVNHRSIGRIDSGRREGVVTYWTWFLEEFPEFKDYILLKKQHKAYLIPCENVKSVPFENQRFSRSKNVDYSTHLPYIDEEAQLANIRHHHKNFFPFGSFKDIDDEDTPLNEDDITKEDAKAQDRFSENEEILPSDDAPLLYLGQNQAFESEFLLRSNAKKLQALLQLNDNQSVQALAEYTREQEAAAKSLANSNETNALRTLKLGQEESLIKKRFQRKKRYVSSIITKSRKAPPPQELYLKDEEMLSELKAAIEITSGREIALAHEKPVTPFEDDLIEDILTEVRKGAKKGTKKGGKTSAKKMEDAAIDGNDGHDAIDDHDAHAIHGGHDDLAAASYHEVRSVLVEEKPSSNNVVLNAASFAKLDGSLNSSAEFPLVKEDGDIGSVESKKLDELHYDFDVSEVGSFNQKLKRFVSYLAKWKDKSYHKAQIPALFIEPFCNLLNYDAKESLKEAKSYSFELKDCSVAADFVCESEDRLTNFIINVCCNEEEEAKQLANWRKAFRQNKELCNTTQALILTDGFIFNFYETKAFKERKKASTLEEAAKDRIKKNSSQVEKVLQPIYTVFMPKISLKKRDFLLFFIKQHLDMTEVFNQLKEIHTNKLFADALKAQVETMDPSFLNFFLEKCNLQPTNKEALNRYKHSLGKTLKMFLSH